MDDFLTLCRAFGHLDELVQAGGGNISVKLDDNYSIIKSSGVSLCDITRSSGYSIVNHNDIADSLYAANEPDLTAFTVSGGKPSLEVYFHSFMKRYVVHLHPTAMMPLLCANDSPGIAYCKPGFDLSKKIRATWDGSATVLLNNHGVIFTADTMVDILQVACDVYGGYCQTKYPTLDLFWKLQYEFKNEFVYKVCRAETAMYLPVLKKYNVKKITPDIALFLYNSIHIQDDFIFIHAPTKRKCLDILEVLRTYCECVEECPKALTEMQGAEIIHWPAERRRLTMLPDA